MISLVLSLPSAVSFCLMSSMLVMYIALPHLHIDLIILRRITDGIDGVVAPVGVGGLKVTILIPIQLVS